MKVCSVCKRPKPVSEFNRSAARRDGLQTKCRACSKALSRARYEANPDEYREANKARRERLRDFVWNLKRGPCTDCKQTFHPVAMDFDHRDGTQKTFDIAHMVSWTMSAEATILAEIAKCDLVCANCHRIRTYHRQRNLLPSSTG